MTSVRIDRIGVYYILLLALYCRNLLETLPGICVMVGRTDLRGIAWGLP